MSLGNCYCVSLNKIIFFRDFFLDNREIGALLNFCYRVKQIDILFYLSFLLLGSLSKHDIDGSEYVTRFCNHFSII